MRSSKGVTRLELKADSSMLKSQARFWPTLVASSLLLSVFNVQRGMTQSSRPGSAQMPVIEFQTSLAQAALTVCALSKQNTDYKVALNASTIAVFQLIKKKYGNKVEGIANIPDDESLIRYLGVKISQAALEFCPGNLPPGVARELSELKQREQGAR